MSPEEYRRQYEEAWARRYEYIPKSEDPGLDKGNTYRVEGLLLNYEGRPISEVEVAITGLPDESGTPSGLSAGENDKLYTRHLKTDPEGLFAFGLMRDADLTFDIKAPGCYTEMDVKRQVKATERLVIHLLAGSTIYGRVTGPMGIPVKGAYVRAELPHSARTVDNTWDLMTSIETDANGDYRIEGLKRWATYTVTVMADGFERFPPLGMGIEEFVELTGESHRLDVALIRDNTPAPAYLTGRVTDEAGQPVDASVSAYLLEPGVFDAAAVIAYAKTGGAYRLPIRGVGRYRVWAQAVGFMISIGEVYIAGHEGIPEYPIVMRKGGRTLTGRAVVAETGAALGGAGIGIKGAGDEPIYYGSAEAAPDGTFRIEEIPPGCYRLVGYAGDIEEMESSGVIYQPVDTPIEILATGEVPEVVVRFARIQ